MTNLTRACYGDPANAYQTKEASSCKGCCYEIRKKTDHHNWEQVCTFSGRPELQRCAKYLARE